MARAVPINVPRVILAGTVATVIAGMFLGWVAPRISLAKLDYPYLLGTYVLGVFEVHEDWLLILAGWLLFALGGVGWAWIYASYVLDRLPGPGWLQGIMFAGIGVFAVSSLVFFPLLSWVHPMIGAGRMPAPGILGLGLSGGRVVVANFLGQCLFGLVLGFACRRKPVFSIPRKEG